MKFEVLIKDVMGVSGKETLLSLINGFEDGKWRYSRFQSYVWDNIAETSLTFRERDSLINHSLLVAAAKNLRLTDEDIVGQGSELAEIVLYGIMKDYYGALPVVPKIFYKQNAQDNAKGSDSVHIVLEGGTDFSLWLGEAKSYKSIKNARLSSVIDSIATSLSTNKLKKENSIITNLSEIRFAVADETLREKIFATLSSDASVDDLKAKLHIPIFLLHECTHTSKCIELTAEYKDLLVQHHKERAVEYFSRQAKGLSHIHNISHVTFHIILLPVPSKDEVVKRFVEAIKFYKDQA